MIALDRVIVSSKDVNRRSGEILDQAEKEPVLVTRGAEPLVIAQHALVRNLVDAESRAGLLGDLTEYLARRLGGDAPDEGRPFDWLKAFDADDVVTFARELRAAYRDALAHPGTWDAFDVVIHEWQESAVQPDEYVAERDRSAHTVA